MKSDALLLTGSLIILVAFILVDRLYVAKFEPTFKKLETQRIITSNKLASAKIVYENLNHVRDLVEKNMTFPGQKDSVSHESIFFDFVTTCVNDLKMKLISCKPSMPLITGNITTCGYDIELEGDFFTLGELCAKFENSRRIISISSFDVSLASTQQAGFDRSGRPAPVSGKEGIVVKMHVNTYRIKKG
ncbi:MAG: hypothetical protein JXA71_19345 [Chitinispirillaceae bacterium]|nr:hypothetical protein [Chitinispirillaceae bacterium]